MRSNIVDTAVQKLNELNMFQCEILEGANGNKGEKLRLLIQKNHVQLEYNIVLQTKVVPVQVPILESRLQHGEPSIVIAEYITPQAKEMMRKGHIAYIDTEGNMYLEDYEINIYIENNKSNRSKLTAVANDAFTPAGLKVIYLFLIRRETLNEPYRTIVSRVDVSIDTVRKVLHGLLKDRYIVRSNDRAYRFTDRARLYQDWVSLYNQRLRPRLRQSRYRWLKSDQSLKEIRLPERTSWGGAVAAEELGGNLIGASLILYTELPFRDVMKELKMIPDPKGNIVLSERFWTETETETFVHPMLVYADLIHEGDPRYMETANMIYTHYVEDQL